MSDLIRVVALPRPLDTRDRIESWIPPGKTVAEVISAVGIRRREGLEIRVSDGDKRVKPEEFESYRLTQVEAPVTIRVVAADPVTLAAIYATMAAVAASAASAASAATLGLASGALGASFAAGFAGASALGLGTLGASIAGFAALSITGFGIAAGVTMLGKMALNALIKPSSGSMGGGSAGAGNSPTIRGAQNQFYAYAPVWRVFGEHWVTFPLAAKPYTETIGGDSFLRMLLTAGYGPLDFEDWRIGETALADFDFVELEYFDGEAYWRHNVEDGTRTSITDLTLFKDDVEEDAVGVALEFPTRTNGAVEPSAWAVRTTAPGVEEISADIAFPAGLYQLGEKGRRYPLAVDFEIQIKEASQPDSAYVGATFSGLGIYATQKQQSVKTGTPPNTVTTRQDVAGVIEVRARRNNSFVTGFKIRPTVPGQYTIRLRRLETHEGPSNTVVSDAQWTILRSIKTLDRVAMPNVTLIALRIKATDQLNGVVSEFRAKTYAKLRPYLGVGAVGADEDGWGAYQRTRNPAWAYLQVLTGDEGQNPLDLTRVDLARIQAWAALCEPVADNYVFTFDHVVDYATTQLGILQTIAGSARGSYTTRDGKHSVVLDIPKDAPVQLFTPRNSSNFRGTLRLVDLPHALRVNFQNEERDNQIDELIVYADGYAEGTATRFETLELLGCTRAEQAFKEARKRLREGRLRPSLYQFTTDVEYIVCERGDRVRLAHDVPLAGVSVGRIRVLNPDNDSDHWSSVESDEQFVFEPGETYAVEIRSANDAGETSISTVSIVNPATSATVRTNSADFTTPVERATVAWAAGDLIAFGRSGQATKELLIHQVMPGSELSATIVASDYAEEIFDEDDLPEILPALTGPLYAAPPPVEIRSIDSSGSDILMSWKVLTPVDSRVEVAGIQIQYRTASPVGPWTDAPTVRADQESTRFSLELGDYYDFRIRTFSAVHTVSRWSYRNAYAHLEGSLTENDLEVIALAVKGRGDSENWVSRDLELTWRLRVLGQETATNPAVLVGYRVQILDSSGAVRRTEVVTDPRYNYSLAKNEEDTFRMSNGGSSLAARVVLVAVCALVGTSETNASSTKVVQRLLSNPAPALPTVVPTETLGGINLVYAPIADPDFDALLVWRGDTDDFVPATSNLIYVGRENPIFLDTRDVGEKWYRWAAADTFSRDPALLNLSEPVQLVGDLVDSGDIEVGAIRSFYRHLRRVDRNPPDWVALPPLFGDLDYIWFIDLDAAVSAVQIPKNKVARVTLSMVIEPDDAHPANFPAADQERYSVYLTATRASDSYQFIIAQINNVVVYEASNDTPQSTTVTLETICPDVVLPTDETYAIGLAIARRSTESPHIKTAYEFVEVEVIKAE